MTINDILNPHAAVLSALLGVARSAYRMIDDADADAVAAATVPGDLDALCAALDRLGEVATDAPAGYAPHPAENAAHMLRHLVNPDDAVYCDACSGAIDGEPLHFSGSLDGVDTGHIHLCASCAESLPRITVRGGVAR